MNSRQVERPNKAYQIAEPDNRAARVEWLSDTVEKAMRGIPGANEDQIILDQAYSNNTNPSLALFEFGTGFLPPETGAPKGA